MIFDPAVIRHVSKALAEQAFEYSAIVAGLAMPASLEICPGMIGTAGWRSGRSERNHAGQEALPFAAGVACRKLPSPSRMPATAESCNFKG